MTTATKRLFACPEHGAGKVDLRAGGATGWCQDCFNQTSHGDILRAEIDAAEALVNPKVPINTNGHLPAKVATFGPRITRLSSVKRQAISWLWPYRIALGKVSLFDGDPGQLKSTIALDLAARVTTGRLMPDGSPGVDGGAVLLTFEDGLADTVGPRVDALGGDSDRIAVLESVSDGDGEDRLPAIPDDIDAIRAAIADVDARLVIIDPLMAALGEGTNSYRDQDVRRAIAPLARLAEELAVAVIVIRHLNKGQGSKALYRGGGSIGIAGAARSVFLAADDPDAEGDHVFACVKINISAIPPALSYRPMPADNGAVVVEWLGVSEHRADALLNSNSPEEQSALDEAEAFLGDFLASGPVPANAVIRKAREAGVVEKTLRRAKDRLKVVSNKNGMSGGWSWELPEDGQFSEDGQQETVAIFEDSGHLPRCLGCNGPISVVNDTGYCGRCPLPDVSE